MDEPKVYYRRHLPHYQPAGATYHVVFRLAGSLPGSAVEALRQDREQFELESKTIKNTSELKRRQEDHPQKYFERFDDLLDGYSTGPTWLKQPEIANIVREALDYRDKKEYDLFAYCIMPNHVHMVFALAGRVADPTDRASEPAGKKKHAGVQSGRDGVLSYKVTEILGSLKKYTALRANRILHRAGAFWQGESYDHVIRNGKELKYTIWYVLSNPVKAGLVQTWEKWPWTFVKPGLSAAGEMLSLA